jgi:mannose-6-phosphate isomerase-like protein (cupin superfamily)
MPARLRSIPWKNTFKINALEEIVVTVPTEKAKHAFCMVEHRSAPNAAPPLHLHRNEDEIFEILEGQFRFWLDGEVVEASPGTIVLAPAMEPTLGKTLERSLDGCPLLLYPAGSMDFSMT